ncbi:hypothetical protein [Streptomyces violascens]|uniref:hypothetical protein n=1 Tax=Streptomyces violascens TaxID=67381 RepID=UPI0036A1F86D
MASSWPSISKTTRSTPLPCPVVAAFQERPGAARHVLMLEVFSVLALDAVGIAAG